MTQSMSQYSICRSISWLEEESKQKFLRFELISVRQDATLLLDLNRLFVFVSKMLRFENHQLR